MLFNAPSVTAIQIFSSNSLNAIIKENYVIDHHHLRFLPNKMMWGPKGILMIPAGPKVMLFHASMKRMTF